VTKADDYLGTIYDAARTHRGERTLFLMSSDHGAQWPRGKWNLDDAGIRVPLIVAWPGVVKPGTRTDAMVSWVDLLPTLVEAAGGTPPPTGTGAGQIDGRSFLDVLRGTRTVRRDRIVATHTGDRAMNVYPIRAVRTPAWKYVRNLHPEFQHTTHIDRAQEEDEVGYFRSWERAAAAGDAHAAAVLRRYRQRPADELYDLARDPLEQRNLAADPAQASRLAAMQADLDAWMRDQWDTQPVFHPPVLLETPAGRQ
jgi:N-sulfoglucosamine sulfohydrolase